MAEAFEIGIRSFADKGDFPFVVSITHDDVILCAGSIINAYLILTSAFCVNSRQAHRFKVITGLVDGQSSTQVPGTDPVPVDKIVVPENFENIQINGNWQRTYKNDIAILMLRYPLQYTAQVQNIKLPSKFSEFYGEATATGWRYSEENKTFLTDALTTVRVPIIPYELCRREYFDSGRDIVKENMLCVGVTDQELCGTKIARGGPIICSVIGAENVTTWVQCGIVVENFNCMNARFTGLFTKVSHQIDWIKYAERKIKLSVMSAANEADLECQRLQRAVDESVNRVEELAKKLEDVGIPSMAGPYEVMRPMYGGLCLRTSNTTITVHL